MKMQDNLKFGTDDILINEEDSIIFNDISSYMRTKIDLEEVLSDPMLAATRSAVKELITDYNRNITCKKGTDKRSENGKFIRNAFSEAMIARKIESEIEEIKLEIEEHRLNEVSAGWIREWEIKKAQNGNSKPEDEERGNFISRSLKQETIELPSIETTSKKLLPGRRIFIRYASLSAAALLGAFIIIRSLSPSVTPENLFNSYYEPFEPFSVVTRGENNTGQVYSSAINYYKAGEYLKASAGFTESAAKDPGFGSPDYFIGMSALALGEYQKAIRHLTSEIEQSGEYFVESHWYLGLAYLKTGNKQKAAEFFRRLSLSEGYYNERSKYILRRLK